MKPTVLRLILGDQLNEQHSWFKDDPTSATYVLMEVREEATYVRHHVQKVVAFFLAMRAFAERLKELGFNVLYIPLDAADNRGTLQDNITALAQSKRFTAFEYQLPDEYRVSEHLHSLTTSLPIPSRAVDSEHFFTSRDELAVLSRGKKQFIMENFYRTMRRRTGFLMDGDEPEGGEWNYDANNRKRLPAGVLPPNPPHPTRDVSEICRLIEKMKIPTIGRLDPNRFTWAVTRSEALELLEFFCTALLPQFGTYQDAMHTDYGVLFHSQLSFAMNVKLLSPKEVIVRTINAYRKSKGRISLPQIEGFVRQILGWREYMRGMYWMHMPSYETLNFFEHKRPLPGYFWSGETKMACVRHAVNQSLETAYAHHIQRLMVTGNFALLAGIDPDAVDAWYLGVYADAVQWVQITNTRGMSQYADGGLVATKPYVSSANYINKMSNYCEGCHYSRDTRVGERACPFNSLYWHFLERNRSKLASNRRIGMAYVTLDKLSKKDKTEIMAQADQYLEKLDDL